MALNLDALGMILMVIGAVGLAVSLLFWSSIAPFGARRTTEYVDDTYVVDSHSHAHGVHHVDPHGHVH